MAMAAYIIGMKKLQRSLLQEKELLSGISGVLRG
jgi:hypothetical protein